MRTGIRYCLYMSVLLSGHSFAAEPLGGEAAQSEVSRTSDSNAGQAKSKPASLPTGEAAFPDESSGSSELGERRAKLLSELNKSSTVELPPAEFLTQLDVGVKRVKNLSLFDAMAMSLEYSNEVAASSAHVDMSESQVAAALGPLLPHIDLRMNAGKENSSPSSVTKLPYYDRLPSDTHNRNDNQLFVRQTLFDLPSYFERQRQDLLLQASRHNLSDVQERVAYDTLISFLKLVELRLTVRLTENYEADLNKLLEYMTARVQAGGATKADMQRVKGRVLNATSAVIEAKGAYESGLVEFKRLTGVVPDSITIPGSLLPVLPKYFGTAMETAIQNNNQLQAALRDIESVEQERRAVQGKYSPKFDIELSAIHTYNAGGVAASDPVPNNTLYADQNDKRAMLVMSWNLLDGGADMMQSKALESKRQEYEYRAKEIQRKLEESLRINFNALRAVNGRVESVRQEMESNDIVLAAFKEQLFSANRSLLDVLDAYQRQFNSRTELTRLLIAEATAGLQMLRNMGKLQEGIVGLR